ncbi:unnamed protein product [Effrenium voratum]|uniref:Pentatricopeptide repeat-containing protein, chloroplastic n=1 Tax=Effrenium voratum TaxID=2562239 RepID=A0AA36IRK1_9DINO|nr:unnamed protein product [Effrenium voratum]
MSCRTAVRGDSLQPSTHLLEKVMASTKFATRWREACLLMTDLVFLQVGVSVQLYSEAIESCSRAGKIDAVQFFLHTMRRKGCWPTERTFNLALLACDRSGQWLLAMALLREMRMAMRDPDVISWTTCISGMEKARVWRHAVKLLEQMPATLLQTDAIAISAAMKVCEKALEWKLPLHLAMGTGIQPDTIACSSVIRALQEGMRWKASCDFLEDVKQQSFPRDIKAYNAAASSLEKVSRWEKALAAVRSMKQQRLAANEATCGIALGACASAGNSLVAFGILQQMVQQRLRTTPQFIALALEACWEEPQAAQAVTSMLANLRLQLPHWLQPAEKEAMAGAREASLAVEMLEQNDGLSDQTRRAFGRRAARPIQQELLAFAEREGAAVLARELGSLGEHFTRAAVAMLAEEC